MTSKGIKRRAGFYSLVLSELENVVIEVEDFVLGILLAVRVIDYIISYLDHIIIIIDMSVYKGVHSRSKSSNEWFASNQTLEENTHVIQIKNAELLPVN